MKKLVFVLFLAFAACSTAQDKTTFSEKALKDVMLSLEGEKLSFSEITSKYKGKKIVIDVWASWCSDCIKGMPIVKGLQKEFNEDIVYVFLSLDKTPKSWKRGIKRYKVEGEHYFISSGWKGDFCSEIDLDWIPRYMVIDASGKIQLFKATKASDKKLKKAIETKV